MDREVMRLRFRCVMLPKRRGFLQKRMIARAAGVLRREGVTRAVFPETFPWLPIFEGEGIQPMDSTMLYRVLASELVQHRLNIMGQTGKRVTVAVCAARLTDDVRRTVMELCIRNRYVMLFAPERNDDFCRKLRREYGVPLVWTEDASQLAKAAVILRFSPETETVGADRTIDLFRGGVPLREILRLSDDLEDCLPKGCDRIQMLAALYYAGVIRLGDMRIVDPDVAQITPSDNEIC